jgi:aspartate carbamoyltransferase catalytic subunit
MKPDILDYLEEHGVHYEPESDLQRVIGEVDVVYQTRIHPERIEDRDRGSMHRFVIDSDLLQRMKPNALILHPLPRTAELDKSVDDDPRALYFRQAKNGLYVRMALLTMLLEAH